MRSASVVFALITFITMNAFAADKTLVKSCSSDIGLPGEASVPTVVEIYKTGTKFVGITKQQTNQGPVTNSDEATITEHSIRAGLEADIENFPEDLNMGEMLVTHALALTTDPIFEGQISAGLDLTKVRSAKVYLIGEMTKFGGMAIVEASDESGSALGSFLGGFIVSPCKL